ncbi:MAG: peptide deformylase [Candidatus Gracilibacteria bacterium]
MALIPIEKGSDNKILRTVSDPVKKINKKKLSKFFVDMEETMHDANGIGLAAPQVGVNDRVVVCFFNNGTDHELIVDMVNPEIVEMGEEMEVAEEGCLSLPGKFDKVARATELTVKFLDVKGNEHVLKLKGLNARIVQHEVDHLDGMLYIDRVKEQGGGQKVAKNGFLW